MVWKAGQSVQTNLLSLLLLPWEKSWLTRLQSAIKHSNNVLDFIIERSNDSLDPSCSRDRQYLTSPVRNSLYGFIAHEFVVGHRPAYVHLASTRRHSCDRCSQAFPVFLRSSTSVYYTERKPKNKNRGRPVNEASVCMHATFLHL